MSAKNAKDANFILIKLILLAFFALFADSIQSFQYRIKLCFIRVTKKAGHGPAFLLLRTIRIR